MRKKSGFKQIGMALLAALYLTGCAGKPEATQTPEPAETTAEETSQTQKRRQKRRVQQPRRTGMKKSLTAAEMRGS